MESWSKSEAPGKVVTRGRVYGRPPRANIRQSVMDGNLLMQSKWVREMAGLALGPTMPGCGRSREAIPERMSVSRFRETYVFLNASTCGGTQSDTKSDSGPLTTFSSQSSPIYLLAI